MIRASTVAMRAALGEAGFNIWRGRLTDGETWMEGRSSNGFSVVARCWPAGWTVQVYAGKGTSMMQAHSLPSLIHALTCTLAACDALTPVRGYSLPAEG